MWLSEYFCDDRSNILSSGCYYVALLQFVYRASKTMLSNRISYWIDGKGPSYSFDNGCAGSMAALEQAYKAMKNGDIECAVVGGSNYCIIPELALNMKR